MSPEVAALNLYKSAAATDHGADADTHIPPCLLVSFVPMCSELGCTQLGTR